MKPQQQGFITAFCKRKSYLKEDHRLHHRSLSFKAFPFRTDQDFNCNLLALQKSNFYDKL